MSSEIFLDTNVIVHLFAREAEKRLRSEALIADGATISVQVLNETALTLRRKLKMSWAAIADVSSRLRDVCDVVPLTEATHVRGLAIATRHQLHVYDSMIVAAALLAGCSTVHSEDLHDGLVIEGLTVLNPFRD
ncbi:MAG TPA: PIN domain-containing protein [Hyphomicrobiaceae bacterium]|nr:PIN domain-containing protein [Hyphomicrobiaceae bacterium]